MHLYAHHFKKFTKNSWHLLAVMLDVGDAIPVRRALEELRGSPGSYLFSQKNPQVIF